MAKTIGRHSDDVKVS